MPSLAPQQIRCRMARKRGDRAHGSATSGLAKFCCASTTPRPEFCMPTSMATVREASSPAWSQMTASSRRRPASITCWRPGPRTDPTICVMAMTATSGATGRMRRLAAGKRHLSRAPATTRERAVVAGGSPEELSLREPTRSMRPSPGRPRRPAAHGRQLVQGALHYTHLWRRTGRPVRPAAASAAATVGYGPCHVPLASPRGFLLSVP